MEKECVSRWGWWQARIAALLALPVLLTGMYGTNYVFLAARTPHRSLYGFMQVCKTGPLVPPAACVTYRYLLFILSAGIRIPQLLLKAIKCHIPECENNSTLSGPVAAEAWLPSWSTWALPPDSECQRRPAFDGVCSMSAFDNTTSQDCEDFVYQHHSSIMPEFGLACQEWKRTLVGTVHNVGMLVSLPIMGYVSDRWGRRAALVTSGAGAGFLGLCKSFVGSYPAYLVAEFLETVLGASVYPAAFVLMIEWLGVEQRILASLLLGIPLSAGAAMLALLDYLTGYWRTWARLAYPPSFLLLLYPWILPESIRWLVAGGKVTEAVQVIKQAAKANRVTIPDDTLDKMLAKDQVKVESIVEEESLFRAFIKYSALRRRLMVCFAWWSCAVFVFYGLAVRAHALAGSAHANYALLAAAELPALLLNTMLLDRAGRRPLLTAAFLLTAVALIAIPCLPDQDSGVGTALFLAGKMGATMALNALYVYTAELFPTRARQRLLAACSTCGRIGAILAPQTPLLAAYGAWVPTTLLGALPLASAALTRLVPDTLGRRLPDSFADLDSSASATSVSTALP